MTENEAIEELKKLYPKKCMMVDGRLKGGFDDHESNGGIAIDMAIQALEKQMAEEPITTLLGNGLKEFHCYKCKREVLPHEKYCDNCGQKIRRVE